MPLIINPNIKHNFFYPISSGSIALNKTKFIGFNMLCNGILLLFFYLTTNFFTRNIVKTKHVAIILKTTTYYKYTNTSTSISNIIL